MKAMIPSQSNWLAALDKELPEYLALDEVHEILQNCNNDARLHLLINFLWQTGARISEILTVTVADIDFRSKIVKLRTLKRQNESYRYLPMQDGMIGELGAYIAENGFNRQEKIFKISRQRAFEIIRDACLETGIDRNRSHPHVFRHSFAVNAVFQGVPLVVLQKWLGHASIQSTLVYLKVKAENTRQFFDGLQF